MSHQPNTQMTKYFYLFFIVLQEFFEVFEANSSLKHYITCILFVSHMTVLLKRLLCQSYWKISKVWLHKVLQEFFPLFGLVLSFFSHVCNVSHQSCSSRLKTPKTSSHSSFLWYLSPFYIFHNSQLNRWRASAVQSGPGTLSS